mmetsp:Transcript_53584/g.153804  ORF Transcript_53584/g.153804 Transcript_53584/m.153804 type:complete len:297 (-) Transcript_53584:2620-3510(-)
MLVDLSEDAVLQDARHVIHEDLVLIRLGDRLHGPQGASVQPEHIHCPADLLLSLHLLDAPHDAAVERLDQVPDPPDDAEEGEVPGAEILQQLAADHLHVLIVRQALEHQVDEGRVGHLLRVGGEQRAGHRVGELPQRKTIIDLVLEWAEVHFTDELGPLLGVLLDALKDEICVRPEDLGATRRQAGNVERVESSLSNLQLLVAQTSQQPLLQRQDGGGRALLRGGETDGRDRGRAHPPTGGAGEQRRQRGEHRVLVHNEEMPERLRHHVADALLVGVRVLAEDGQHPRHVRPEVLA